MLNRNELYFDRVHAFVPILQRRRYFSLVKKPVIERSHACLQFAMWTLSASLSTQFEHIRETLYRLTRNTLHTLELTENGGQSIMIQEAQAWLLVAVYELIRGHYRRCWMSAGSAFRLIQLMGLYEIDGAESITQRPMKGMNLDWAEIEEERRTFWMAYCLDRFIGIRNGSPLTFNEQVVRDTRLIFS
jgi:hypothetical protein